ncbi:MAG: formylglycine-generating enzyme family protein, partial [Dehalococcoidia bacterium]
GNVWEWCADWFDPLFHVHGPRDNPSGPPTGTEKIMRGGSFLCHESYCFRYRVAARSGNTPDSSTGNLGFRGARDDFRLPGSGLRGRAWN